jgi:hypothetical protein
VLKEKGEAMTCPELIDAMAAKGYWSSPGGKTPASTLYAAIHQEIKTKARNPVPQNRTRQVRHHRSRLSLQIGAPTRPLTGGLALLIGITFTRHSRRSVSECGTRVSLPAGQPLQTISSLRLDIPATASNSRHRGRCFRHSSLAAMGCNRAKWMGSRP